MAALNGSEALGSNSKQFHSSDSPDTPTFPHVCPIRDQKDKDPENLSISATVLKHSAAQSLSFKEFHFTSYTSPKRGSKGICSRLRLSTNHQHGALEVGTSDYWKCSSCWEGALDECKYVSTSWNFKNLIIHQRSQKSQSGFTWSKRQHVSQFSKCFWDAVAISGPAFTMRLWSSRHQSDDLRAP